jgi:inorganic pyrophosphatase
VIVVGQVPVVPGAIVRSRPIGALLMKDEAGQDEKIIAVPVDKLHPFYRAVKSFRDLPEILCEQIGHFFQHYKDLEKGKWVTLVRWADPAEAAELIREAIIREGGTPPPPVKRSATKQSGAKTARAKRAAQARRKR